MNETTVLILAIAGLLLFGGGALVTMSNETGSMIAQVARNAGFSDNDLITAVAIAYAESGGDPNKLGDIGIGEGSFGLWQISSYWHPEYGPNFYQLYDPQTNANAAYQIYLKAGGFTPWTTFKTGTYQEFMTEAQASI